MPALKSSQPRWQRRPEFRAEEIIDAAYAVFGEHGYARTKLDDVARRAGVSKGTLYLYYDSKETLFREMVRAKIIPCVVRGEELLRTHEGSARELLVSLIERMWAVVRTGETARISRLVHSELGNFPELAQFYFDEVISRSKNLIQAAIDRGIASGEFRRTPNQFAPRAISSLLVHAGQYQNFFAPLDPHALTDEQVLESALDFVLHGVTAPSAAPRSGTAT